MNLLTAALLLPVDISIDPNSNGPPGIGQLKKIVGASMAVGLVLAVPALIIAAIVWARRQLVEPAPSGRGNLGVLVALGAAVVCGASVTLVNFFWNVGQQQV